MRLLDFFKKKQQPAEPFQPFSVIKTDEGEFESFLTNY